MQNAKDKHMTEAYPRFNMVSAKGSKGNCILELHASDNGNKHSSLCTGAGIQQKKCESKKQMLSLLKKKPGHLITRGLSKKPWCPSIIMTLETNLTVCLPVPGMTNRISTYWEV